MGWQQTVFEFKVQKKNNKNKIHCRISVTLMVDMTDFLAEPNDRATKHAIIVQCKVNI